MRRTRPLPDTHPELSVIEWPSFREYRVENWRLARDGSGNIVRGATSWAWIDLCLPVLLSFIWPKVSVTCKASSFRADVSHRFAAVPSSVHSQLGSSCTTVVRKFFMVCSTILFVYPLTVMEQNRC